LEFVLHGYNPQILVPYLDVRRAFPFGFLGSLSVAERQEENCGKFNPDFAVNVMTYIERGVSLE
jgi:hypothetical protein